MSMTGNERAETVDGYLKRLGYAYEKKDTTTGEVVFTYRVVVPSSDGDGTNAREYPVELVVPATDGVATSTSWIDLKEWLFAGAVPPESMAQIIVRAALPEQPDANGCCESFTMEDLVLKCVRKVPTARLGQETETFIGRCAIALDALLRQTGL